MAPDKVWKKGDAKRRDFFQADSGFNIEIADGKNPRELCNTIRAFLHRCSEAGVAFHGADYSCNLSGGVTLGTQDQYVAVVEFTAEDLLLMGKLGVELSIAAYPSSDND